MVFYIYSFCFLWWCIVSGQNSPYREKLLNLRKDAEKTVLVHVHVPKAGGTAVANALSSSCHHLNGHYTNCREVRGSDGSYHRFSINRDLGWPCGVHQGLDVMRDAPCLKQPFNKIGIRAVFVVFIRNPFERFLSEVQHWGGGTGRAFDWGIRSLDNKKKYTWASWVRDEDKTNDPILKPSFMLTAPQSYMFHNRQIKMIGGRKEDFNRSFVSHRSIGSAWIGKKSMEDIFNQAVDVITEDNDIILGVEEDFAECICVLEIIYGNISPFHWDPLLHSHSEGGKIYNSTEEEIGFQKLKSSLDYDQWVDKNREDIRFYNIFRGLAHAQFRAALDIYGYYYNKKDDHFLKFRPHCKQLYEMHTSGLSFLNEIAV